MRRTMATTTAWRPSWVLRKVAPALRRGTTSPPPSDASSSSNSGSDASESDGAHSDSSQTDSSHSSRSSSSSECGSDSSSDSPSAESDPSADPPLVHLPDVNKVVAVFNNGEHDSGCGVWLGKVTKLLSDERVEVQWLNNTSEGEAVLKGPWRPARERIKDIVFTKSIVHQDVQFLGSGGKLTTRCVGEIRGHPLMRAFEEQKS